MPRVPVPLDELLKLANDFVKEGRHSEAERLIDHVLSAVPDMPPALHLKGIVLFHGGHPEAAAGVMERALELAPDTAMFCRDLCPVYERLGRYDDALRVGRRALDTDGNDLQTLHNLALVHYRRLELDRSIAYARRALALDPTVPGAHFQLAEALLLRGEFGEGWQEYEWRYQTAGAAQPLPPSDRPQWDGAPFSGRILLLIADQGFGDVIQYCRYIPWVRRRCPEIVVAADTILHPLIRQIDAALPLIDHWSRCPPFAAFCPLSGLPRLHGTTLATIPSEIPYLRADPVRTAAWRARLQDLLPPGFRRIGIVWAGRPTHNNDFNRSVRLPAFAPLAALDGIALVSLQKGSARSAIGEYFERAPLLNLGAAIGDFVDTMAIIDTLDLVVTVDTSVAHLAGAMGRPVWVLLPYAPDWRWLLDRDDSPWYPTARLFRQPRPGDWGGVIRRVCEALQCHGYAGEVQADRCDIVSAEPRSHSPCNRSGIIYNVA
jgi:hypothetical protein